MRKRSLSPAPAWLLRTASHCRLGAVTLAYADHGGRESQADGIREKWTSGSSSTASGEEIGERDSDEEGSHS
jgi:hypothetical protein